MNIKIVEEKENSLLSRKEVKASVSFEGATPSRKDIQKEIAKKFSAKEELTIIKVADTQFGDSSAKVVAYIYSDEKVMIANERKNLIEKHAGHEPKTEGEEAN